MKLVTSRNSSSVRNVSHWARVSRAVRFLRSVSAKRHHPGSNPKTLSRVARRQVTSRNMRIPFGARHSRRLFRVALRSACRVDHIRSDDDIEVIAFKALNLGGFLAIEHLVFDEGISLLEAVLCRLKEARHRCQ